MAQLGNIDATQIPERSDFSPVPKGRYRLMITASDMKQTKDQKGQYLALEMDIQDGEFAGRKLFERLNLDNPNQTAVDIAYRTLGEICRACNKPQVSDSEQLHNILFEADVDVDPGRPYVKNGQEVQGNPQNVVKRYYSAGAAQQPAEQQKQQTATGGSTPPWRRS